MRSQANDPNAGSEVVGRVIAPTSPPGFVGSIPPADREAVRANFERLWGVALRNPALNPPKGFDLKTELTANGILPGPREPFIYRASGLLYWYTFMPGYNRVRRLDIAMHGFFVLANHLSVILADKWKADEQGAMYYEPREIRRVAGFPQYSNGMIAVSNSSQPLWMTVPRERVLRQELTVARAHVDAIDSVSRDAAAYDPAARLAAWLRERPNRQRDADKMYEDTKRQDPQLAEQMRANFAKSEELTEKTLRQLAERNKTQPPAMQARRQKERQDAEDCVKYLEGELARLSPADLKADAYVALAGRHPLPKAGCSAVVEAGFPDAVRIVTANPHFFDTTLPRTAFQLIVVDFTNFEAAGYPRSGWRHDVYERLREGLDYKALAGLLAKR
ncbi:MAG: hypothetical protein LAP85_28695 [Acidobacteriia bacterium]|nr:hypothetical protein [Terriglobia bacterium]